MRTTLEGLVLVIQPADQEQPSYHPLVLLRDDPEGNSCENCGDVGKTPVYASPAYDDAALTIRQYQTGGEPCYCEACEVRNVLGAYWVDGGEVWTDDCYVTYFVRPDGDLPEIVKAYGGC